MKYGPALFLVLTLSSTAMADEGMWTFDNFPSATVRSRYGVNIDQKWLDRTRGAVVRLEGGCTGSFASADGLILTNHHCAVDCLSRISTKGRDAVTTGFSARTRAEEERCSAEQVSVLERLEDVTGKVTEAVGAGIGPAANEKRKARLTQLEQACEDSYRGRRDPHSCEAVTLYGGGQYFLYHYRRYSDVRLVFAPEADVAFFGGDIDNFEFPRWNLDFSVLRAYDNGKPARTPNFLHWRRAGPEPGEAVFVAGHPGSTERLSTVAQLRFQRDPVLSHWLQRASELRGRMLQFSAGSEEQARIARESLFGLENSFKVRRNENQLLLNEDFMATRWQQEEQLRAAVAADPGLQAYAQAWPDIEGALARYRAFYDRHNYIEDGGAFRGDLAGTARAMVRAAMEREKPNEQRQREYTDAALPKLRQQLLAPFPVYRDLETLRLTASLEKFVEFLGIDDPAVRLVLGRESAAVVAARMIRDTQIGDPDVRQRLWEGGRAALEQSADPLIALALRVEPEAQLLRKRYEDEVEAVVLAAQERLALARFAVLGKGTYPDATFTLRLSYGAVQGWREGDRDVAPYTTFGGLFARATGQQPFVLPQRWIDAERRVSPDTRFNLVTTNDIVGGNSGSPLLDARGRLVGLVFDGNRHSIGGNYWFDPALNRTVAVHPAALLGALSDVYDARELLRELTVE